MQKKLTLLYVTNNYTPYSGGVVSSINAFRSELERQGHTVYVATLDFLGKQQQAEHHIIRLHCPLRFSLHGKHAAVPFRAEQQLEKIIQKIKPDIVHVHHPFLLGPLACKTAKRYTIPTVFTYHTMYEAYAYHVPLPERFSAAIVTKKVQKFCKQVAGIIAPSSSIANRIGNYKATCPVATIPSPVADMFFTKKPRAKKNHATLHLLHVGRFAREKNISALLDIMAELIDCNVRLTLVGYGPQQKNLERYALEKCKLSCERVQFVIQPTKEQLIKLYQQADLFVFASGTDTQALVLAEAMASGLPVVALPGPGQNDIIKNGVNGFLVQDTTEMVCKLKEMVSKRESFAILQDGALQTAAYYQSYVLTEKLVSFYREIIKS